MPAAAIIAPAPGLPPEHPGALAGGRRWPRPPGHRGEDPGRAPRRL